MKITQIRIFQLASIKDCDINFDQAPLKDAGIFAITGETGAGKSTLLDAICLALFAQTARLSDEKGNKVLFNGDDIRLTDPRNLLRRGCSEGFAEVSFIGTDGEPYRARWYIARAYKKPDGKLKAPQHSVFCGKTDEVLSDKSAATAKQISQLIGLNFAQFTRAVLLAQNEFAAFLKATSDERANLLECLTDTQHFAVIGQRIYERMEAAKQALIEKQNVVSHIHILSDEERTELNTELNTLTQKHKTLTKQLDALKTARQWYTHFQQIEQQLANHGASLSALEQAIRDNAQTVVDAEQVSLAHQHAHLVADLDGAIQAESNAKQHLNTLSERDFQSALKEKELALSHAQQDVASCESVLSQLRPHVKSLIEKTKAFEDAKQTLAHLTHQHDEAKEQVSAAKKQTAQLEAERAQITKEAQLLATDLNELSQFSQLGQDESRIHNACERAFTLSKTLYEQEKGLTELNDKKTRLEQTLKPLLEHEKELTSTLLDASKQADNEVLAKLDHDFTNLNAELAKQDAERIRLTEQRNTLNTLDSLARENESGIQELASLQASLSLQSETCKALEARKAQSEQVLAHLKLTQSAVVTELRDALVPGEACLVCGSTDHDLTNLVSHAHDAQIKQLQSELDDIEKAYKEAQHLLKTREYDVQLKNHSLEQNKEKHTSVTASLDTQFAAMTNANALLACEAQLADIQKKLAQTQEDIAATQAKRQQWQQQNQVYQQLNTELTKLKAEISNVQAKLQDNERSSHMLAQQHQQHTQNLAYCYDTLQSALSEPEFKTLCQNQGVKERFQQQFSAYLAKHTRHNQLTQRLGEHQAKTEQAHSHYQALTHQLSQLAHRVKDSDQNFTKLEADYQQAIQHMSALCSAHPRLQTVDFSQGVSAMDEVASIKADYQTALTKAEHALQQCQHDAQTHQAALKHAQIQLQSCTERIQALTERINAWLNEHGHSHGLTDLTKLRQCLTQDKVQANKVLTDAKERETRRLALSAQMQTMQAQRDELVKNQPEHNEQHVKDMLSHCELEYEACQSERVKLSSQLETDSTNKRTMADITQKVAELKTVFDQWKVLSDVVGDAQGKKLRNLAQTHTLRVLLDYANHHLKVLSKRYRLCTIGQSLNLAVIDADMADEMRSVNTLSGGESFLVSLALALGLASLSSNKVRIDSLFIDEGFGTLDSDTLSVAMDALDALQAGGRKVGVISHISEMTERVHTQIQVQKRPGGYSEVKILG